MRQAATAYAPAILMLFALAPGTRGEDAPPAPPAPRVGPAANTPAVPAKKPPTEAEIRQWIADLGSDSFEKREAATKRLDEADEAAAPFLEQVKSDDPEVRQRVKALIDRDMPGNHSRAGAALKSLVTQEGIWRAMDIDRNGVADYWTRDVAAFYTARDASGNAVKLIDRAFALADAEPARAYPELGKEPVPKHGYFFRVIKKDLEGNPYINPAAAPAKAENLAPVPSTNPSRFAFCAYPARYRKDGRLTFIVNEQGVIWEKDLGPGAKGVDAWPAGLNAWPAVEKDTSGWKQFGG
jgi:hypothetical protein